MNDEVCLDWRGDDTEGKKLMKPIGESPSHWSWPIIETFKSKDDLFWYYLHRNLRTL